jgi:hypothetical protein
MKKILIMSIFAILIASLFFINLDNEEVITKSQTITTQRIPYVGTPTPVSIYEYYTIMVGQNEYFDKDNYKINLYPGVEFCDEEGNYDKSLTGEMVCAEKNLDCIKLQHKYNDLPWKDIPRNYTTIDSCTWKNISTVYSNLNWNINSPWTNFWFGVNRIYVNWKNGTQRNVGKFNYTIQNMNETHATIITSIRYIQDRDPQIISIPLNEQRLFDEKGNSIIYLRKINMTAVPPTIDVTIFAPGKITYRVVCGNVRPAPTTFTPTKTLRK